MTKALNVMPKKKISRFEDVFKKMESMREATSAITSSQPPVDAWLQHEVTPDKAKYISLRDQNFETGDTTTWSSIKSRQNGMSSESGSDASSFKLSAMAPEYSSDLHRGQEIMQNETWRSDSETPQHQGLRDYSTNSNSASK